MSDIDAILHLLDAQPPPLTDEQHRAAQEAEARRRQMPGRGRRAEFFHGSNQEFSPGDVVLPARQTGVHRGGQNTSRAWATTRPDQALNYGDNVYRVRPVDPEEIAPNSLNREYGSKSGFEVLGKVYRRRS